MHRPVEKKALAIIPARFGSTRFPGKPLVDLAGVPMVVRVAARAQAARSVSRVVVATDDVRIAEAVGGAGFHAVMTPDRCASGTDRVAAALDAVRVPSGGSDFEIVVNVQGDEPLIDPDDIDVLVTAMLACRDRGAIGTLARRLDSKERFLDRNVVKVTVTADGRALYFSRAPIPEGADPAHEDPARRPLQHVGLYAYPPDVLKAFAALPASPLEMLERLEQLRAMENGIAIHVAMCASKHPSIAIDTPEDVEKVLAVLRRKETGRSSSKRDEGGYGIR